jgi:phage baseplate assembly protein W
MAEGFFDSTTRQKEIYSDIDLAFLAHPITGKLSRKINRDAVKQSVKSLIMTDFYERPFKPLIGCGIRQLLFENFHPAIVQEMKLAISEVIDNYEPRAELISVDVDARPDANALSVSIVFYVINDSEPVVLDVILERIR